MGLEGVTILLVSHDYDFLDEVATDIAHYDNGGKAGNPCRLVYYRTGFKGFQKLKPEIVAGLPTAAKTMGAVGGGASESESESESDGSLVDGVDGMSMGATIDHVDALIASGQVRPAAPAPAPAPAPVHVPVHVHVHVQPSDCPAATPSVPNAPNAPNASQVLPIRFPDPGKPEGIRTFRKPVMTLKDVSFKCSRHAPTRTRTHDTPNAPNTSNAHLRPPPTLPALAILTIPTTLTIPTLLYTHQVR